MTDIQEQMVQTTGQNFDFDYLVIGSGFGGSVSAMRLSQKGYNVGVIESGKRWANEDFAKTNWNLRKYLWMPKLFLYGIQLKGPCPLSRQNSQQSTFYRWKNNGESRSC